MSTAREALAEVIWSASRADEGTISATGANVVADAILTSPALARLLAEARAGALRESAAAPAENDVDLMRRAAARLREVLPSFTDPRHYANHADIALVRDLEVRVLAEAQWAIEDVLDAAEPDADWLRDCATTAYPTDDHAGEAK
jgi:hypothetical protein